MRKRRLKGRKDKRRGESETEERSEKCRRRKKSKKTSKNETWKKEEIKKRGKGTDRRKDHIREYRDK